MPLKVARGCGAVASHASAPYRVVVFPMSWSVDKALYMIRSVPHAPRCPENSSLVPCAGRECLMHGGLRRGDMATPRGAPGAGTWEGLHVKIHM